MRTRTGQRDYGPIRLHIAQHDRQDSASKQIDALDVDFPTSPPIVRIRFSDGNEARELSGVVDEDVQSAIRIRSEFASYLLHAVGIGDVQFVGEDFRQRLVECFDGVLDGFYGVGLGTSGSNADDGCACFRVGYCSTCSDSLGRTGYEDRFTLQVQFQRVDE